MKSKRNTLLIKVLFTLLCTPTLADENNPFQIGAIIASGESLYIDSKTKARLRPRIYYQNGWFFINGTEAGAIFLNKNNLKITGSVNVETRDIDRGDSAQLSDMESLNTAIDAKLGAIWKSPLGQIDAQLRRDIAGAHGGLQAGLEFSKPMILGNTRAAPFLSVDWMSAETAHYYYGVSASDAMTERPTYAVDDAIILSAGIKAIHPITKNLSVLGMLKIERYDSEITDSPIIDKDQSIDVGVGLLYNF